MPRALTTGWRARIFPDDPTKSVVRLEDEAARATSDYRARSIVLGILALICLPLAMAGIIGALLHSIRQQAHEIGVRLALGAEASQIRRRFVRQALQCVAAGLALGLLGGLGLSRWMSAYLFGVGLADPLSVAGVSLLLVLITFIAALWPAYRASRLDAALVLRE